MKISHKLFLSYIIGGLLLLFTTVCALYYLDKLDESSNFITHELVPLNNASKNLRNYSSDVYGTIQVELFGGQKASRQNIDKRLEQILKTIEFLDDHRLNINRLSNSESVENHILLTEKNVFIFIESSKDLIKAVGASTGVGTKADEEFDGLYDDIVERLRVISEKREFTDAEFQKRIGDARYLLAHGHLLTAEILSGDFGESFKEVTDSFDGAFKRVLSLQGFKAEQEFLLIDINKLKALAQKRYEVMITLHERKEGAVKNFDLSYSVLNDESLKLEIILNEVLMDQRSLFDSSKKQAQNVMYIVSLLGISLVCLIVIYYSKSIMRPFSLLTSSIENLSNLEVDHVTPGLNRTDEIGRMAEVVEEFKKSENARNQMLDDLKIAIDETQKANEAKSQFLANMSHEIRTPLNSIIGYSDILADDELSFEQRNMANSIKGSSETLLLLVNDILDLAKVESGEMTLECIEVNLEDILFDVGEAQVAKVHDKKIEVNIFLGDAYALVLSDPTRLKQVFINLLNNAIKFTDQGEVLISVKVLEESEKSQTLRFSVKDTGIGMTEEQAKIIFEAFKQADGSTTRKYGGTGLGLNITRQILLKMGSEIQVNSTLGEGTEFYFDLAFEKFKPEDVESIDLGNCQNKKVLIVDDNKNAREITSSYFENLSVQNYSVDSADMAFEFLKENKVDFIILDLMMPVNDGYQVASKVRKEYPDIIQIAVTADIRPGTIARVKEVGFDAYLLKPIRRRVLIKTIQKVFGDYRSRGLLVESMVDHEFIPRKILVVDDNRMNLKLAEKVFTKMGHRVHVVDSGYKCLEIVQKESFDIVFMDMQMPEMSGVEATIELRKRNFTTPVVALTANAFESDKKLCLDAGMDDFVTKPLRRDELYQVIYKFTDHNGEYVAKRILIIEDDKTTATLLFSLIDEKLPSATVKIAENGMEALTLIGSFYPHSIVLDFMLPDMDGIEVMKFIKSHSQFSDVKVIVNTSLSSEDERIITIKNMGDVKVICKSEGAHSANQLIDFLKIG